MKGFIEVNYLGISKYTINVNQIIWFSANGDGKKTLIFLTDNTRFTVDENYDEVKARIAKSTAGAEK